MAPHPQPGSRHATIREKSMKLKAAIDLEPKYFPET